MDNNSKACLVLLSPLNTLKKKRIILREKATNISQDTHKIQNNKALQAPINGKRLNFESKNTQQVSKKPKTESDIEIIDSPGKENKTHNNSRYNDVSEDATDVITISKFNTKKKKSEEEIQAEYNQQLSNLKEYMKKSSKYADFLEKNSKSNSSSFCKNLRYFKGELRDYQIEGVTWLKILKENAVNGILADEMGLGKTIQIIALFCHLYEQSVPGPYLVLAPLSTLGNWYSEFQRFAPEIPVVCLHGDKHERQTLMSKIKRGLLFNGRKVPPVVICSYQLPFYETAFVHSFTWQYIVVDEGHKIKNSETQLAIELRQLRSINRTLLTGTPLQNDIKELWSLFGFLMPQIFNNTTNLDSILELEHMRDKNKLLETEAKDKIISGIQELVAPFMLRREKKFVLPDIVPKKEVVIYCSLTPFQNYLYRAVLQDDYNKLKVDENQHLTKETRSQRKRVQPRIFGEEEPLMFTESTRLISPKDRVPFKCLDCKYMSTLTLANNVMILKKIVNHPYLVWTPLKPGTQREMLVTEDLIKQSGKLRVLDYLLPKLKAGGHKVLIFSTLVMLLDLVEEMLMMRNFKYSRLDGSVRLDSRNSEIDDFMTKPDSFVFLISTRAGGLGLNLTAADTVIFMDPDWNPMADMQAKDRCHRIGQTKPVVIYNLITKGTIDQVIVNRGLMKKRLEKIVIQEGRFKKISAKFNRDQLQVLENLLNEEEDLIKVRADGLMYTDAEFGKILDRSDLYEQMAEQRKNCA